MKKFLLCAGLIAAVSYHSAAQQLTLNIPGNTVTEYNTWKGTVSQRVPLKYKATPQVKLSNVQTEAADALPEGVKASNSFEPDIFWGLEKKKPVAFVNIPAYRQSGGRLEKLVSYDLEISEWEQQEAPVAQKPTAATSLLATGTWYKIAVPSRGIYKIDYAFLQSLGINPAGINPANIRIYGHGGTPLPEKVTDDQPDDLVENAIWVQSSGSTFGTGDYVLFYANGPNLWTPDASQKTFRHTTNPYENQSYYFLNFDLGPGKRITAENATGTAAYTATTYDDYTVIDPDSFNVGGIGKVWWGYRMNTINPASWVQDVPVNLGSVTGSVRMDTYVGLVSDGSGNIINIAANGTSLDNVNLNGNGVNYFMNANDRTYSFSPGTPALNIRFQYSPGGAGAAYVDYIRFNYKRPLVFSGGQMAFRDWGSTDLAAGENAAYPIQGAGAGLKVWEITDPLNPVALNGTAGAGTYTIVRPGHELREFISFDGSQYLTPTKLDNPAVPNQNLHALPQTDFLIITTPLFRAAAEDLAAFHRTHDQISATVVTVGEIYNEFSSGSQDIGGIRNFIRMFYDRGGSPALKNVLFFGAASYDYKNRLAFNTNFVPTYETQNSIYALDAYSSDDFFALLDEGEDINAKSASVLVDIGIGRIPAFTAEEAANVVAKIKHYASPASFGPWKNVVTYVADDVDIPSESPGRMNHLNDCETVNKYYYDSMQVLNLYKIYADAYKEVSTPSGGRYPMVNKAINDQIYSGTLLMSYSGHGSPDRWAHEAILSADDYGTWTNKNKLPVLVTATCDFGRFDDPGHRSAGAKLLMNPNGGAIGLITTTMLVFGNSNTGLNQQYTAAQFTQDPSGSWPTLGEALRAGKNNYSQGRENNHKFVVLGDPALKLQMPVHKVQTEKLEMLDNGITYETDTIKALGKYMLTGSIRDAGGNKLTDFNGKVSVTIFDKMRKVQTANPDPNATPYFNLQTNAIAKLKGTVTNGDFSVTFIAPKDINYAYGLGKVSYYAYSNATDAAGLDTGFTVGDFNPNAAEDNDAPIVKPYIDNEKFRNGGVTGPNPLLFAKLFDENGINVSGNSIGHDLVAILDDDIQNPFNLNNLYEPEEGDYRNGTVSFQLQNLPEGVHTIRVKAWDVYNNSGEGTVTFEVKNKDKGFISDLYNYPNPVYNSTHFVFQHNQEAEDIEVTLQIFTAAGRLVKTIKENLHTTGNRTELTWDGLGEGGAPLPKGVYFYRLHAVTSKGISATAYQKLVLLR